VFEFDPARKQVFVAGVVEGGPAEQRVKVAGLNPSLAKEAVRDGGDDAEQCHVSVSVAFMAWVAEFYNYPRLLPA
jgi:hypothetical protein